MDHIPDYNVNANLFDPYTQYNKTQNVKPTKCKPKQTPKARARPLNEDADGDTVDDLRAVRFNPDEDTLTPYLGECACVRVGPAGDLCPCMDKYHATANLWRTLLQPRIGQLE